ncbi:F0F1 ATP synthase subunit A [Candidatus Woesebacteria bacterium]|nr:F0F1 ATP synthase subunit A [Candidatus Woesebacteria bacterium]
MSANIHISLSAEPIFNIGTFPITNSMFTSVIISTLIILFAFIANRQLKQTSKPSKIQNFAEFVVESFYHFCFGITGDMKKAQVFMPWVATFFIFIILNNWSGLIPGVGYIFVPVATEVSAAHQLETPTTGNQDELAVVSPDESHAVAIENLEKDVLILEGESAAVAVEHGIEKAPLFRAGTADLNITLALGLISVVMIQFFGFKFQGFRYLSKYFDFSSPINFFVGILEIVSEFAKIISFGFRLFGNIFAGEVLIAVLLYLTKAIVPVPFYGLEIFVGMIQAVVFSMLSLVLYNMATIGHHEEH